MTDSELTTALKNGNQEAFRLLVECYGDRVLNTALGLLQNKEEAEDLSQEVFIEVYQKIAQFKGESKLSTWVYRITVNRSLDVLKSKKRKKRFAFVTRLFQKQEGELNIDIPHFVHPGVQLEEKERACFLFRAIEQLPESQKTAFTLQKIEGLNQKEIAEILKTSEGAVESLLVRARQNLVKSLREMGITE